MRAIWEKDTPVEQADLELAFHHDQGDFEDAMQVASALACGAEHIVTRGSEEFSGFSERCRAIFWNEMFWFFLAICFG